MRRSGLLAVVLLACMLGPLGAQADTPPANDHFAQATEISTLPFVGGSNMSGATFDSGTTECTGEPSPVDQFTYPAGVPPVVYWDGLSAPDVWYRYTADRARTLLVSTNSNAGGPSIDIYLVTPDGLRLIVCGQPGEWWDGTENTDDHLALFSADAGATYALRISGGSGIGTLITVEDAPVQDLGVSNLRVDTPPLPTVIPHYGNRQISFNLGFDPVKCCSAAEHNVFAYTAESCPVGNPAGCSTITSEKGLVMEGATVTFGWTDAGCLGDVEIRVDVTAPFVVDPNPNNNAQSKIVDVIVPGGGTGVGVCPVA